MPDPLNIVIQNIVYRTAIINGEMDAKAAEIAAKKLEIQSLNDHLKTANAELNVLQRQFMSLYIQQTGGFPTENSPP